MDGKDGCSATWPVDSLFKVPSDILRLLYVVSEVQDSAMKPGFLALQVTPRMKQIRKVNKNLIIIVSKEKVQRRTAKTLFVTDLMKYIGASQK